MSQGYDQFFKKAKKNAQEGSSVNMKSYLKSAIAELEQQEKDQVHFSQKGMNSPDPSIALLNAELEKRKRNRLVQNNGQSKRKGKKRNKIKKRGERTSIPLGLSMLCLGLSIALAGLFYVDDLDQLIGSYEIGFISGAQAVEKAEEAPKPKEKMKSEKKKAKEAPAQGIKNWNEQDLDFLSKLESRKNQLDEREKELAQVEEELKRQKQALNQKIEKLQKMRDEISKVLKDRIKMDDERVGKLVDFYSNMKPAQAAQVFAEINEDLAVEILGRMKKKNAAAIMNLLKPDKAQVLSEKFAGYRRPASN